jgi:hypothetical protein
VSTVPAPHDGDARLTADRHERKYLVPAAAARRFADALSERLRPHRFRGEGANALPGARHFVTTIYFDTVARDLYRAAASPVNVKLRAKEYYDVHPALVEIATDPRELLRYQPILWLEVKERDHDRTSKRRVGIPKRDASAFLAAGTITPETLRLQEDAYGADGARLVQEVVAMCRRFSGPIVPACLVNYRRRAWQDDADTLRVTLDLGLAFYAAPDDLFARTEPLLRETLPPPAGEERRAVVEVKGHAGVPGWLQAVLEAAGAEPSHYSKFEAASRAIHG